MSSQRQFGPMITPIVIQVVYWILIVLVIFGALAAVQFHALAGAVVLIAGLLAVRIIAEVPMLVFRMGETVNDIKDLTFQRVHSSKTIPRGEAYLRIMDFITFRRMITPDLIMALTVLLAIAYFVILIAGFAAVVESEADPVFLVIFIVGFSVVWLCVLLVFRIITEVLLAIFGINGNLSEIRNVLLDAAPNASDSVRFKIREFVTFRRMVTPIVIQMLYWIATVAVIYSAFDFLFGASEDEIVTNPLLRLLLASLLLIGGFLVVRILAEMSVIPFRINGTLTDIKNLTLREAVANAPAETGTIGDFIAFRRMISPILIQLLYWILSLGVGVGVLWLMFQLGQSSDFGMGSNVSWFSAEGLVAGATMAVLLLFLLLIIRTYAEQFLVTFRINETLTDIRNVTVQQAGVKLYDESSSLGDFITFGRMISPIIIRVLYWVLTVAIAVGSIAWLNLGSEIVEDPAVRFLVAVAILIVGLLAVRVYSEALMVAFRINETFTDIRDARRRQLEDKQDEVSTQPASS